MMSNEINQQINLLINKDKNREQEFLQIMQENRGEKYIATAKYRERLLKRRDLEQELSFNKLKKDFNQLNLQELKQDLQILDLKYIKIQEVNYILKIMNRNRWTIKDLYKLFYEGNVDTIKSIVCCKKINK